MQNFETMMVPTAPTVTAPDGLDVRVLLSTERGSMCHYEVPPGQVSKPVVHKTVEEVWYVLSGAGAVWRKQGDVEEVVEMRAGVCFTIPVGTAFQFRAYGHVPVVAVAMTMGPWPGMDEAVPTDGAWEPTLE